MKRQLHPLLKACSTLPAVLLMCIIFSFSSQTGEESAGLSYEISSRLVDIGQSITGEQLSPQEREMRIEAIHTPVRKAAHMSEYCLLALAFSLPLTVYGARGMRRFLLALLLSAAFAASDEFHQSFVGGRGPSVMDVGIDSLGAAIGCAAVAITAGLRRRSAEKKAASQNKEE